MSPHPHEQPLSAAMRSGSAAAHRDAESAPFVVALLDGRVGRDGYAAYLRALREVYGELEPLLREHRAEPAVAAVWDPALERCAALDADLAVWDPAGGTRGDLDAVRAYRGRLAEAAARPELLVAHHYTRYLGDLAGGQAIGHALRRHYGPGGLGFYDFPGVPKPVPYRRAYRARVDALPLTAQQRDDVVAEVRTAFALNRAVFDELGTRVVDAA